LTKIDKYTCVYSLSAEIKESIDSVVSFLKDLSSEVSNEDIYKIALTSANFEEEVARTIEKSFMMSGKDGFVDLKPSGSDETLVKSTNGMTINSGFLSESFLTSGASSISLKKCEVFVFKKQVSEIKEIEEAINGSKNCLVLAYDFSDSVIDELVVNRIRHKVNIIPIKTPMITSIREDIIEDVKCYCEGKADEVVITKFKSTIIRKNTNVKARINFIEEQISHSCYFSWVNNELRL